MARFLIRFGNAIFLTFIGASVALLFAIHSVFNGGFSYALKTMWLPLGVLIFGFTWRYRHDFERISRSRSRAWIFATILYPIAVLMSWPYVMVVNALTTSGETITYEGPIADKWISSGRVPGYQIVILDQATEGKITLSISESRYNNLAKGELVQEKFSVGGLGIPFRWGPKR